MNPVREAINSVLYLQQLTLRFLLDPVAVVRAGAAVASELAMDRRLGVRTAYRGFRRPTSRLADSTPSQPITYVALEHIERDLVEREVLPRVFVDLGCGRGRALAYFSRLPFEELVGVEVDPEVATVARANVDRIDPAWKRARQANVVLGDAADYALPSGSAVLLLTNPFGESTLRSVLLRLRASLSTQPSAVVDVYYAYPVHHRVFREVFAAAEARALSCRNPNVYHYRLTSLRAG